MGSSLTEYIDTPAMPWRRAPSLVMSLMAHLAGILLLFVTRIPSPMMERPGRLQSVALIMPVPLRQPAHRPVSTPLASMTRAAPRRFQAPPILRAPALERIALEPPPATVIETPRPATPAAEMPRVSSPPPPLKTDNLASLSPAQPTPAVAGAAIHVAGFSGVTRAGPATTRGVLRATNFGNAAGGSAPHRSAPEITRGGFGDVTLATAPSPTVASATNPSSIRPVEILAKPRPAYTDEARRLRIEGEVLVELLFAASGEARVLRLVRGLGHGLDDSAIAAAQAIRFRPAERAGTPVDSTAIVHIVFQLAY
jgi:TonB family protein